MHLSDETITTLTQKGSLPTEWEDEHLEGCPECRDKYNQRIDTPILRWIGMRQAGYIECPPDEVITAIAEIIYFDLPAARKDLQDWGIPFKIMEQLKIHLISCEKCWMEFHENTALPFTPSTIRKIMSADFSR